MALSNADQANLNEEQKKQVQAYKDQWAAASAAGDQAGMDAAHAAAEAVRAQAAGGGYSGGSDGGGYSLLSGAAGSQSGGGTASNPVRGTATATATRSASPSVNGMTAEQMGDWVNDYQYTNYDPVSGWTNGYSVAMNQRSIANKIRQQMQANSDAWAAADAATQAYLHDQNVQLAKLLADSVGGAESTYNEQLGRWETYNANLGYGVNMNYAPGVRDETFKGNTYGMTEEQMDQYFNDTDRYRNYVDQRVVQNWFDPSSGYTGIYSQFVNGPYGRLLAGTNGVNQEWYMDVIGDGFAEGSYADMLQNYQENGPIAPPLKNNNGVNDYTMQFASYVDENGIIQPGDLQKTHRGGGSRVVGDGSYSGVAAPIGYAGGVISDGGAYKPSNVPSTVYTDQENKYNAQREAWWKNAHTKQDPDSLLNGFQTGNPWADLLGGASGNPSGTVTGGSVTGSGATSPGITVGLANLAGIGKGMSTEQYLQAMYNANLQAQALALEQAYNKNLADLATAEEKAAAAYDAQKRQTDGQAARQASGWREVANAMGLNSGAFGQAALAQNNQLQSDLNTLGTAQAQSQAELERQRALLGQEYQNAILQAQAENNMDLAYALYQEAVRQDEALRQQQQFEASLAADMTSQLLSMAGSSSGGSRSSSSAGGYYDYNPDYDPTFDTPGNSNGTGLTDEQNWQQLWDVVNSHSGYTQEEKKNLAEAYWKNGLISESLATKFLELNGLGSL